MKNGNPNPPAPLPTDEGAIVPAGQGEILLYQTEDGRTRVECRFQDETIWLSQAMMAELYQTSKQNVSLHLHNLYREGELDADRVVKEYLTTGPDGRMVRRTASFTTTWMRSWRLATGSGANGEPSSAGGRPNGCGSISSRALFWTMSG